MYKKPIFFILSFIITFYSLTSKSYALGIGPFGSFGIGQSSYEIDFYEDYKKEFNLLSMRYTFGLVMDTAVAMDKAFNYRMHLGYGFGDIEVKTKREDNITSSYSRSTRTHKIYDLSMYNDFGFGIIRSEYIRFWLGPQAGMRYSNEVYKNRYWEFAFSVGFVMGLNVNIGKLMTIFFDGGIRFHLSFAERPWFHYGYEGYITSGIMFRLNDTHGSSK